jgi:hypothetical protein
MRASYNCDLNPQTGETLTLEHNDRRTWDGRFYTEYQLYSPIKGILLTVKITDAVNANFIAW